MSEKDSVDKSLDDKLNDFFSPERVKARQEREQQAEKDRAKEEAIIQQSRPVAFKTLPVQPKRK